MGQSSPKVKIWTDGSFKRNRDAGGAVLTQMPDGSRHVFAFNLNGLNVPNNNIAELWAITVGLEIQKPDTVAQITTDSQESWITVTDLKQGPFPAHRLRNKPNQRLQDAYFNQAGMQARLVKRDDENIPVVNDFARAGASKHPKRMQRLAAEHGITSYRYGAPPKAAAEPSFRNKKNAGALEKVRNAFGITQEGVQSVPFYEQPATEKKQAWIGTALKKGWIQRVKNAGGKGVTFRLTELGLETARTSLPAPSRRSVLPARRHAG